MYFAIPKRASMQWNGFFTKKKNQADFAKRL
jgi:hypothetical protein